MTLVRVEQICDRDLVALQCGHKVV
jgi:hypothetical protein